MRGALIHQVRLIADVESGPLNMLGERTTERVTGPWIRARVMETSDAPKNRRGESAAGRVQARFEVLLDSIDVSGAAVVKPTASAVLETDCPVLNNPTIVLTVEPETLTPGVAIIGYRCLGDAVKDRS